MKKILTVTPRRHHYVPIFYLMQWTGLDGKLCQMSRPFDRVAAKRRHPSGVAYKDDLYTLSDGSDPRSQWIEDHFLKVADQQASDALKGMLAGNGIIDVPVRTAWTRFLMSLMSRTPDRVAKLRVDFASELEEVASKIEEAYDEAHKNDDPPPTREKRAEDIRRENEMGVGTLLQKVMDLPNAGKHIINMCWSVFNLPNGRRTLLTSDNPIFISHGLQFNECHIALPISPSKLFVAANDEGLLRNIGRSAAGDITGTMNQVTVTRARRYVYGTDDFQRNFVDKYLSQPTGV